MLAIDEADFPNTAVKSELADGCATCTWFWPRSGVFTLPITASHGSWTMSGQGWLRCKLLAGDNVQCSVLCLTTLGPLELCMHRQRLLLYANHQGSLHS